jgi:trk system potassium uptake protein TrkH
MIFLMFIGASPGSCGGGVKTTTLGVLVALVLSRLHGRESADIFGRRIPSIQVAKALATLAAALGILAAASFAIQFTEYFVWGAQGVRERFLDYLFEVVSALGTVGLSTGITPTLSVPGRMVIVITMLAGRLGPLSVAVSLVGERKSARYEFPEESVMVG